MDLLLTKLLIAALALAIIYMVGRLHGYTVGKIDGISQGWKRGWTQPRDDNGRYISPHRWETRAVSAVRDEMRRGKL